MSADLVFSHKGRWSDLLGRFEEDLRTRIFIADQEGRVITGGGPVFGEKIVSVPFCEKIFGFSLSGEQAGVMNFFSLQNNHLAAVSPFDFYFFAASLELRDSSQGLGNIIFGPVILNKPWADHKYCALIEKLSLESEIPDFLKQIKLIPCFSPERLDAVLKLLSEVIVDVAQLNIEKMKLEALQGRGLGQGGMPRAILDEAENLHTQIQQDELLVAMLDQAMRMTNAQGGSIMIFDHKQNELVMQVSRGLENKKNILQSRQKLGTGIAGIAAESGKPVIINSQTRDARFQSYLTRPEIKLAYVVPLVCRGRLIGVLNLHSKEDGGGSSRVSFDEIKELSSFLASALNSL